MKKLIIIMFILLISVLFYFSEYNILNNNESIENAINLTNEITIQKILKIENYLFVFYTINNNNNQYGKAILKRGLNTLYKIKKNIILNKHPIGLNVNTIEVSSNKSYIIIFGENEDNVIHRIDLKYGYNSYTFYIEEKYFCKFIKLNKPSNFRGIKVYDKGNNNIINKLIEKYKKEDLRVKSNEIY